VKVSPSHVGIGAYPLSTLIPESIPLLAKCSMNFVPFLRQCSVDSSNIITPQIYFSKPSVVNNNSL